MRAPPRPAGLTNSFGPDLRPLGDDAAILFEGTELREVVSQRDGACAYRVGVDGEEPLEARLL